MDNKVKALIWEECRVGGAIALTCWLVGSLVMLFFSLEPTTFDNGPTGGVVFLVPFAIALLLILNPDHRGILRGGFSQRILELPVATIIPVAVTLLSRTCLVFVSTLLTVAVAQLLFGESPGIGLAFSVTIMYLLMQTLDWLRAPLSGLTSTMLAFFIGAAMWSLYHDDYGVFGLVKDGLERLVNVENGPLFLVSIAFVTIVSVLSFWAVSKTRIGRSYGFPEIWTWHRSIRVGAGKRLKPFQSAMHAQVWLNLRRSLWIMPFVSVTIVISAWGINWLVGGIRLTSAFWPTLPLVAIPFGALLQGAKTGILGYRNTKGMPGYTYLQPMNIEQYAYARMISNALQLMPLLALAMILHFTLPGTALLTDVIPGALEKGLTSYREVIWGLLSRGLLVGLLAWMVLALSTRLFLGLLGGGILVAILVSAVQEFSHLRSGHAVFLLGLSCFVTVLCIVSYYRAWKNKSISTNTVIFWCSLWAVISWVIYGNSASGYRYIVTTPYDYFRVISTCLGLGSFVALPFVATLFDVRKKRHSARPSQNPAQFVAMFRWSEMSIAGKGLATTTLVLMLGGLWLGVPQRPAFEALLSSQGLPVTSSELNVWYKAVPDDENVALEYTRLTAVSEQKQLDFRIELSAILLREQEEKKKEHPVKRGASMSMVETFYDNVMIVGNGEGFKRNEPITQLVWESTEKHWEKVTQHVAPGLKAATKRKWQGGRYPIDLKPGFAVVLPHLSEIRGLARELAIDAQHWAMAGDSAQATDSILAILPLANSLENEPILISQLVRVACYGIAIKSLENTLNRCELDEQDLKRLQETFETYAARPELSRGLAGERVMAMSAVGRYYNYTVSEDSIRKYYLSIIPLHQMVDSNAMEHMVMGMAFDRMVLDDNEGWEEYVINEESTQVFESQLSQSFFIAPMAAILLPALNRSNEALLRSHTQFEIAAIALAVERYRLTQGQLPKTLDALVPDYIDTIPQDYYAKSDQPLHYRIKDNDEFVVYSYGINRKDDGGDELPRQRYREGDYTFTVPAEKFSELVEVREEKEEPVKAGQGGMRRGKSRTAS